MDFKTYLNNSLTKLTLYIENENYKGYDPYDVLNTKYYNLLMLRKGKWARILLTQLLKFLPLNLRPLLGVEKETSCKIMALILKSYILMYKVTGKDIYSKKAEKIKDRLMVNYTKGYSGPCWGLNFVWATTIKTLPKDYPTVVISSFVLKSLIKYYELTKDKRLLSFIRRSSEFILNDLPITKTKERVCFSYTPRMRDICHNANLLGAEVLTKIYTYTKEEKLFDLSKKAFDFTIFHQNKNGSWNYSINIRTNKPKKQIDFHQGFILNSIDDFIICNRPKNKKYLKALAKGANFYKNKQFFSDGRSKWRWPKIWPVDIRNQAQGIITFSKLSKVKPEYLDFAKTIANWTIKNMQDKKGYFYYQKWPFFTNKIPYMRWGQAWMMLALATLLNSLTRE